MELRELHVDLAADFEQSRGVGELTRQRLDQGDIMGHVVPAVTVAACDRPHETALFVSDGEGDPVDLGFDHEVDVVGPEGLLEPLTEGSEIAFVIGIVQRKHRLAVVALLEPFGAVVADPQFWSGVLLVFALEFTEASYQLIEFKIGDFRGVFAPI